MPHDLKRLPYQRVQRVSPRKKALLSKGLIRTSRYVPEVVNNWTGLRNSQELVDSYKNCTGGMGVFDYSTLSKHT